MFRSPHPLTSSFFFFSPLNFIQSIALQTRHILDEMNSKGHTIDSVYMSGGQVKNVRLMSLLSSVCRVPVILPPSSSAAVVSGSAMLGRYAYEVQQARDGRAIGSMKEVGEEGQRYKERLWEIMVSIVQRVISFASPRSLPSPSQLADSSLSLDDAGGDDAGGEEGRPWCGTEGDEAAGCEVRDLQGEYRRTEEVEEDGRRGVCLKLDCCDLGDGGARGRATDARWRCACTELKDIIFS